MKSTAFPVEGLLPKHQTQALSFLDRFPEYDGRGTVIAILDTGVDPGAPGLKFTSDGRQKIIDVVDCTGSGDVPTQIADVKSETTETGSIIKFIVGLSGRKLILGDWNNPSGVYRIGLKHSSDLYPKDLKDRLESERKIHFEKEHHKLLTKALNKVSEKKKSSLENTETIKGKNADAEYEVLTDMMTAYKDPGICMDCIVFHDGDKWRAAIDTSETGDLTNVELLTNFRDEYRFRRLSDDSMLNYSVNIYDEGEILSIVTVAGSHGTHVAAISAAYFPEDHAINGVAPGAQIVSLKIGDTRLGSMETGTGLVRAAIELSRMKVDLANISYGEASAIPNFGRFVEILKDDVINKGGCIVVSSAGNAGPALTTVGACGGTTDAVISVGAYVNHAMMDSSYAMLAQVPERPYTWSSRGPTSDGHVGVDVYAPGAAITSVPQYTIKKAQLMNGTSMSSPNACGCLALILSGLKIKGVPYDPYKIKAALKVSAIDIGDPFNVGFIQVEQLWDFIESIPQNYLPISLHYNISVKNRDDARGIYLRDLGETSNVQELNVFVTPNFMNKDDPAQNISKLGMEVRIILKSSEGWIVAPNNLYLNNSGQSMTVRVDPTSLKPGFHFGTISGYDSNNLSFGALFSIPVTVCKPESSEEVDSNVNFENLSFGPGEIFRKFVTIPSNCNFVELIVSTNGRNIPARFLAHLLQIQPQSKYSQFEHEFSFSLLSSGVVEDTRVYTKAFTVLPGVTMEICLAQFWSSLGQSNISVALKYHSVMCASSSTVNPTVGASGCGGGNLLIQAGTNGFARLDISSPLRQELVSPKLTYDVLTQSFRPTDFVLSPMRSRDVLPNSHQIHELVNTYSVKIPLSKEIEFIIPRFHGSLYDSNLDNFGIYVYDVHKKVVLFQDVYSKPLKLSEGEYTVRVQFTSASLILLRDLKTCILQVNISIDNCVTAPISKTIANLNAKSTVKTFLLRKGERATVWVGDVPSLPKFARVGDLLSGKLEVVTSKVNLLDNLYQATYIIPPVNKEIKVEFGTKAPIKSDKVLMSEKLLDMEIVTIKTFKCDDEKLQMYLDLEVLHPLNLSIQREKLVTLNDIAKKAATESSNPSKILQDLTVAAKYALNSLNEQEVALYYGIQHDFSQNNETDKILDDEMEAKKLILVLAYRSLCQSYRYEIESLERSQSPENTAIAEKNMQLFSENLIKVANWTRSPALDDGKYLILFAWRQSRLGYHGIALKAIIAYLNVGKNATVDAESWKELSELKYQLLQKLDWNLWSGYEKKWNIIKFPRAFADF